MKALIIDLWNGEGYSDSKAYLKNFNSEDDIREYCFNEAIASGGGAANLMRTFNEQDNKTEDYTALTIGINNVSFTVNEDSGSVHYHLLSSIPNIVGVILHPNVNDYKIITNIEEFEDILELVRTTTEDFEEESELLETIHHAVYGDGRDLIVFDLKSLENNNY